MNKTFVWRVLAAILGFGLGLVLVRLTSPATVTLEWETASEVGSLGFYIYRAEAPDGPFVQLNQQPVPVQGDALTGASYTYRDTTARWGQQYYYQLESLEQDGTRSRYPDVITVRAGLAWPWLVLGGAGMAIVAVLLIPESRLAAQPREEEAA